MIVFRHALHLPSETFIRSQTTALQSYEPVMVARRKAINLDIGPPVQELYAANNRFRDLAYGITGRSTSLLKLIRKTDAKLIHAHFGPDGYYAADAARRAGIPLIVTLHGRDVMQTSRSLVSTLKPVAIRYALGRRSLARHASVILCVSEYVRRQAIDLGIDRRKLVTHHIGIDTDRYRVGLWPRNGTIVHVARLVEKKGTDYLIRAFSQVSRSVPGSRLVIIGDGPLREELEHLCTTVGVNENVDFTGVLSSEEVLNRIASASVVACPSVTASNGDREGLPIALLEAMSSGTPVVATRHAGIPEAISGSGDGWLVEERDVSGLAVALTAALTDPGASRVGAQAARTIQSKFNLRTQTHSLELIYERAREDFGSKRIDWCKVPGPTTAAVASIWSESE